MRQLLNEFPNMHITRQKSKKTVKIYEKTALNQNVASRFTIVVPRLAALRFLFFVFFIRLNCGLLMQILKVLAVMQTLLTAQSGFLVTTFVIVGFGLYRRHRNWFAIVVDSHKREVGAARVRFCIVERILSHHPHSNLHRGFESAVQPGIQRNNVAELDRLEKANFIHGSRNTNFARMAHSYERGSDVHPVHEASPEQITELIGIVRQDKFSHHYFGIFRRFEMGTHSRPCLEERSWELEVGKQN